MKFIFRYSRLKIRVSPHIHSGTNEEGTSTICCNNTGIANLVCHEPDPTIDERSEDCSRKCRAKLINASVCIADDEVKFVLNFTFVVSMRILNFIFDFLKLIQGWFPRWGIRNRFLSG